MYEAFFGLAVKPFELLPNPKFLFPSRSHRRALNYLKYGLRERAGFILLTGEVGSGKTTIIRDLIGDCDSDVVLAMLFNTKVSNKQVLAMINEEFGLPVAGRDKVALLRELNDFLVEMHAQGKHPVLIIDEAQNLSSSALEEIRLLSNLESPEAKLLQIILVGQPELGRTIAQQELRQLRQRISVHCRLDPLNRQETEEYVLHRLELAGNRHAVQWATGTFDALYRYSHGLPRLINIFCDFILLAAFVEETRELTLELVEEVLGDTSWDREVRAQQESDLQGGEGRVTGMANHQILERLSVHEQKLAQFGEIAAFREELGGRIQALEALIKEMHEDHQGRFRQVEDDLARTCLHLQTYVQEKIASQAAAKSHAPVFAQVKTAPEPMAAEEGDRDEPPLTLDEQYVDEDVAGVEVPMLQDQRTASIVSGAKPTATVQGPRVAEPAKEPMPQAPPRRSLLARWFT